MCVVMEDGSWGRGLVEWGCLTVICEGTRRWRLGGGSVSRSWGVGVELFVFGWWH